jgi:hypothetical protein
MIDLEAYVGTRTVDLSQYLNGAYLYLGKLCAEQTLDEFFGYILPGLRDQSRHRRVLLEEQKMFDWSAN